MLWRFEQRFDKNENENVVHSDNLESSAAGAAVKMTLMETSGLVSSVVGKDSRNQQLHRVVTII
jgi:hypothetical protein